MYLIQQILFVLLFGASVWLFAKKAKQISRNINLGREKDISGDTGQRWKNVMLIAFGQKKMFKYPLVGLMHFVVYIGFVIINIEVLEIILDGVFGTHRLFAPFLGNVYGLLINSFEFLAAGVLIACVIFFIRRNVINIKRVSNGELKGWPKNDANLILVTEIVLMSLFLSMNAADQTLQQMQYGHYTATNHFLISGMFVPMLSGFDASTLVTIERTAWWMHIAGILAFLNYLPYSKHLHILLAFPNTYYSNNGIKSMGKMTNMPEIQNEVLYAMQPELAPQGGEAAPMKFGAKDVTDLTWKNLLDAYSCTECGRCTAACPANITGKKLSPRKIMMDTRDRAEEIGRNINKNGEFIDDGKTLLHDYITVEELRACTTCQACVEACPVTIDPLDIIVQLRRQLIMEESNAPQEWNAMASNIENNFAPWKFSPDDRDKWAVEMEA